jgi:hypothetical protein
VEGFEFLAVVVLMFVCVTIQGLMLHAMHRGARRLDSWWQAHRSQAFRLALVYLVILVVVLIHAIQAGVWAAFFHWVVGIRPWHDAYYHSILSLTTMDDSSGVLPERWRLLGAAEGLLGWIVFSWSTAAIFMFLTSLRDRAEQGNHH